MNDAEFERLAGAALERIEQALEASGIDADFELKEGGILELEFADGSKLIVNRHRAAREIWVAARSGGFHFRWDDKLWRDTRDGSELFAALSSLGRLASRKAAVPAREAAWPTAAMPSGAGAGASGSRSASSGSG